MLLLEVDAADSKNAALSRLTLVIQKVVEARTLDGAMLSDDTRTVKRAINSTTERRQGTKH